MSGESGQRSSVLDGAPLDVGAARAMTRAAELAALVGPALDRPARRESFVKVLTGLHDDDGAGVEFGDDRIGAAEHAIRIRRYRPTEGQSSADDVIVFLHGGGWVSGDLRSAHPNALAVARAAGREVVSVDYRLAPEHPFPAGLDDVLLVTETLRRDQPARRVLLVGDSAGANLAAAAGVAARRAGSPTGPQLLFYPPLDPSTSRASFDAHAEGGFLTTAAIRDHWRSYLAGGLPADLPLVDPTADVAESGAPPTVIAAAGHDPLTDDAAAYACALVAAGVEVHFLPWPALPRGWLEFADLAPAALLARTATLAVYRTLLDAQEH